MSKKWFIVTISASLGAFAISAYRDSTSLHVTDPVEFFLTFGTIGFLLLLFSDIVQ